MKYFFHMISLRLAGLLCWLYIWIVALTSRILKKGYEIPDNLREEGRGFIFCLWHNRQFFLSFSQKNKGVSVLISKSKDGEYIAGVMKMFGVMSIRGSSSKGGIKALVQMIRTIKSGKAVAITPDGPRGPVYEIQPGIIHASRKTGCPIIPVSCAFKRKIEFSSWDRYQIPYPFNKIAIEFGKPFNIDTEEPMEQAAEKIKSAMDQVSRSAEEAIHGT